MTHNDFQFSGEIKLTDFSDFRDYEDFTKNDDFRDYEDFTKKGIDF